MTILQRPPIDSDDSPLETKALIKEAKRIRRKRQSISTLILVVVVIGGSVAYNSIKSPHLLKSSPLQTLDSSHSPVGGKPANPRSEIMSITTVIYSVGLPPYINNRQRDAITLQTSKPSIETLSGGVHTLGQLQIAGTAYLKISAGKWKAYNSSEPSSTYLAPNGPDNTLGFFREVALGALTTLGRSNIGGISTTEYRATVSDVQLFRLGAPTKGGLTYIAYREAQGNSLLLTLHVEIWVNSKEQILQARAKSNPVAPSDLPLALASSGEQATVSISDFGVPVRVSAPPARDVIPKPTITSSLNVSGTLYVSGAKGVVLKESGLLSFTAPETGSAAIGFNVVNFSPIAVDTNGTFNTDAFGFSRNPGHTKIVATFYPDPSTKLSCQLQDWAQLSIKKATKGYNIVCR